MNETCESCRQAIPDDAPEGLCPVCLSRSLGGFFTAEADRDDQAASEGPAVDPGTGDPIRIGPYRIVRRLGEGGFAIVYLARQERPVQREVALKIIKPGMDSRECIARFESERQALAMMDHPNIATVFEAGTTLGHRPYFAMEYVPGAPLIGWCREHRTGVRDRLRIFREVCHAVEYAHRRGIIHRDLKPTNILVTTRDNPDSKPPRPVPILIDFGIAKALRHELTEKTLFTRHGEVIGTPEYMSPEQIESGGLDIDTRTDVYSLGILLYELLTNTTPFDRRGRGHDKLALNSLLDRIIEFEPPRPSTRIGSSSAGSDAPPNEEQKRIRRLVRTDLDWIVMRAIEKERERRYPSADALAADLDNFLHNRPVEARPPSSLYRARKFIRKHWLGTSSAAAVLLALLVGTTVSLVMAIRADRAREIAEAAEGRTTQAMATLELRIADELAGRGLAGDLVAHLCQAVRLAPDSRTARTRLLNTLGAMSFPRPAAPSLTLTAPARDLLILPARNHLVVSTDDRTLELWDLDAGARLQAQRITGNSELIPASMQTDSAGRVLTIQSAEPSVHVFRTEDLRPVRTIEDALLVQLVATDCLVLVDPGRNNLRCLSLETAKEVWETRLPLIRTLAANAAGTHLAVGQSSGQVRVLEIADGTELASARMHSAPVDHLAVSPTGLLVATARAGGTARVWETGSGRATTIPSAHRATIGPMVFTADGLGLLTAPGPWVHHWNSRVGTAVAEGYHHPSPVTALSHSPTAPLAATADGSDLVRVINSNTGKLAMAPIKHPNLVRAVAFHPDRGGVLATACRDGTLHFWDVRNRAALPPPDGSVPPSSGPAAESAHLVIDFDHRPASREPLPAWFPEFAERLVARRVNADGEASLLPHLTDGQLRAMIGAGHPGLVSFARWLVAPIEERPLSPGGLTSLSSYLAQAAATADEFAMREAMRIAPRNPALMASLARSIVANDRIIDTHRREAARYYASLAARTDPTLAPQTDPFLAYLDSLSTIGPKHLAFLQRQKIAVFPIPGPEDPQLNLLPHYNAGLDFSWHDGTSSPTNSLLGLPRGIATFGGVAFDIRGLIQLNGRALQKHNDQGWPTSVVITAERKCRKLHFFHAAAWIPANPDQAPEIGSYRITFSDGHTVPVPVRYGHEVWGWFLRAAQRDKVLGVRPRAPEDPLAVWHAPRPEDASDSGPLRTLYLSTWENPRPEVSIAQIEYRSAMTEAAPFLLAITAE